MHTPTPWKAHLGTYENGKLYKVTAEDRHEPFYAMVNNGEDAAFIVRAVNAYAELVAALREYESLMDRVSRLHPSRDLREVIGDPASLALRTRAALAKAQANA